MLVVDVVVVGGFWGLVEASAASPSKQLFSVDCCVGVKVYMARQVAITAATWTGCDVLVNILRGRERVR